MSAEQLNLFFSEIASLTRNVTVDILPFDCEAQENEIFTWNAGAPAACERTKGGGTDFNAITNIVNDPCNRGRWDGLLIMTDGQAFKPKPSRVKRGWILCKGCTLAWGSSLEPQIHLDDARSMNAW